MDLPPLPEGSAIRISNEGEAAILEWPNRSILKGRRLLPSLAVALLVVSAAASGVFDDRISRVVMASLLVLQCALALRLPHLRTFKALAPSVLGACGATASVFLDGATGRFLLASGMGLLFLPAFLGLFRATAPSETLTLRMDPEALTWPTFPGRPIRKEEFMGSRAVGETSFLRFHTPWLKAELPIPGSLGAADAEWVRRALEGWKAGVMSPPSLLGLPPFPEGLKLSAEDALGVLRIQWGVRAGEFRRKMRVLVYGILMLGACGVVLPYTWAWKLSIRNLSGLALQLLVAWAAWKLLGREMYRLAHATGHALLQLDGAVMTLDPGAGQGLVTAGRGQIASVRVEKGKVLLALAGRKRPLGLELPGPAEAAWTGEVLARWRSGPA